MKKYEGWEHKEILIDEEDTQKAFPSRKCFGTYNDRFCFITEKSEGKTSIIPGYFIGVDWLVKDEIYLIVAPKLDTRSETIEKAETGNPEFEKEQLSFTPVEKGGIVSIDYFNMLRQCLDTDYLYQEIDNLVHIDWAAREIPVTQSQDWLSPLLIVKYLNLLKSIVRKGLKKSYYPVTQNLQGKIKGKILVGPHIKQNVQKNRFLHTLCRYDEFGTDNIENRLLNKAFQFACAYLDNHSKVYKSQASYFTELVNYCRPAFTLIGNDVSEGDMRHYKPNPFFKEYTEGIHLAKLLLKRFSYSVSNTVKEVVNTPPYWIDMPKLFELYAYRFLKELFPKRGEVAYHFRTYGNELDFLVKSGDRKMVVDAKYKPSYKLGINHNDMRQLSGYARLDVVFRHLGIVDDNALIDCLVIYPDIEEGYALDEFKDNSIVFEKIRRYRKMYKIGIKMPVLS